MIAPPAVVGTDGESLENIVLQVNGDMSVIFTFQQEKIVNIGTKLLHIAFNCSVLIPLPASAVSTYNPTISILPINPITGSSSIIVELGGDFSSAGYKLSEAPKYSINEYSLRVDLNALRPQSLAAAVITPFKYSTVIGTLQPGLYDTTANFIVNGAIEHTIFGTFVVSAVPEPETLKLFLLSTAGLILFIALRSQRIAT